MRFERRHSVLPGFGLTLGFTLFYISLVVLIPLAALALKAASFGWEALWQATTAPRALASYRLTFGASQPQLGDRLYLRPRQVRLSGRVRGGGARLSRGVRRPRTPGGEHP